MPLFKAVGSPRVLFLGRTFKGNEALRQARRRGREPWLLTTPELLAAPWDRSAAGAFEVSAVPSLDDWPVVRRAVAWLSRSGAFERVVPLDDPAVDLAAHLRAHLQLPGQDESHARLVRDKLAMRRRARAAGVPVPPFTGLIDDASVVDFVRAVPGPWLLKPRGEASSRGIVRVADKTALGSALAALGEARADFLLEQFVPGDLFHVDALVDGGQVVFDEAHAYHRPLLEVVESGGSMQTRTVPRFSALAGELRALAARAVRALGVERGVTHTELLRRPDGSLVFIESAARVGGAHIPALVEAATGVNLWREAVDLELLEPGQTYAPPAASRDHAALLIGLARSASGPRGSYARAGVAWTLEEPYQAGVVLRHATSEGLDALLADVEPVFMADLR